ncbi:hypothetical protein ABIA95_003076 [Bradyrhizobium sp. LA8.1]|uniref:hypothetical protein n=1 Tax=unclassified Bradyrhizobium TaxID=2631580 RepID=UPI00339694F2
MPTQILAIGVTAADSADQVVSTGTPLTVCLKDAAGPAVGDLAFVDILLKDDAGQYFLVETLSALKPALMIVAPGTYRFSRRAGVSCGVFSG